MDKIASPDQLEVELRRLLSYAQSPRPSRAQLSEQLIELSRRVAKDFGTPEALKNYLHEHPHADPKNHHVVKNKEDGSKEVHSGPAHVKVPPSKARRRRNRQALVR